MSLPTIITSWLLIMLWSLGGFGLLIFTDNNIEGLLSLIVAGLYRIDYRIESNA